MIAAVFSDSHGSIELMCEAVRRCRPDLIIHLGDFERDADSLRAEFPHIPMFNVCGNCDFASMVPLADTVQIGPVKAYICHGHSHNVKLNLQGLYYAALERGASIALFGHTHIPCNEDLGGLRLINPGSAGRGRAPTWARLEVFDNGGFYCQILEL